MADILIDHDLEAALFWAEKKVQFEAHEVIRKNPWGITSKLTKGDKAFYLKAIPSHLTPSISIAEQVSKVVPEYAPKVISKMASKGWFILEDHEAHLSPTDLGIDHHAALDAYAELQAKASKSIHTLKSVNVFSWENVWERILNFADPGIENNETGNAKLSDFLGAEAALFFRELLIICSSEIQEIVAMCSKLPMTINHGDLHSNNFGVNRNGEFKFHDWDNALVGPAGLSLNSYCGSVAGFLRFLKDGTGDQYSVSAISHYCKALAEAAYAETRTLEGCLPGSIFAGLFNSLSVYDQFVPHSLYDKDVCIYDIQRLTADITECCFILASENPVTAMRVANHIGPQDSPEKYLELTKRRSSKKFLEVFEDAEYSATVRLQMKRACEINASLYEATLPDTVPRMRSSWLESSQDHFSQVRISEATNMFNQYGCLVLEDAFPKPQIKHCLAAYRDKSGFGLGTPLEVGNRRYMLPLKVSGPFNSPEIYASGPLMAVLENVLGTGFVLGSMSLVVSKPGAEVQHMHMDHPSLFPELGHSTNLPSHAVTVLVPLVEIDEKIGGTEVVKGSHIHPSSEIKDLPLQSKPMELGSCLLFDYRLYHRGLANRTRRERPVLSLVYQRPWFKDSANFHNQKPLQLSEEDASRIPEWALGLFSQITERSDD